MMTSDVIRKDRKVVNARIAEAILQHMKHIADTSKCSKATLMVAALNWYLAKLPNGMRSFGQRPQGAREINLSMARRPDTSAKIDRLYKNRDIQKNRLIEEMFARWLIEVKAVPNPFVFP